ncbi:hypothetical protein A3728_09130 [Sulfitobacter sp. HI0040]|nr:hypothetical protein A3721_18105 [Sulfitobacter sp. HI0023]KZY23294.1 hypothetical protein A3728_09130 [Sulfitobacter sp. HI0040]
MAENERLPMARGWRGPLRGGDMMSDRVIAAAPSGVWMMRHHHKAKTESPNSVIPAGRCLEMLKM